MLILPAAKPHLLSLEKIPRMPALVIQRLCPLRYFIV